MHRSPSSPTRSIRRACLALVASISMLVGLVIASPAGAGFLPAGHRGTLTLLPAPARTRAVEVRDRVSSVRGALAAGGFATRMATVFGAGGGSVPVTPELPTPSALDLAGMSTLPIHLQGPVAGLSAAVDEAIAMIGPHDGAGLKAHLGRFDRRFQASRWNVQVSSPPGAGLTGGAPVFEISPPDASVPTEAARRRGAVIQQAALLVAAALDRYVPMLMATGATGASRAGLEAPECDLLDQTPYLCVSTDADNTYTSNQALIVDLGGNDTYLNTAGGAPFTPPGGPAAIPVSLNLDLSGDDRYDYDGANQVFAPYEYSYSQGGAGPLSIGMLVDMSGVDSYRAAVPPPTPGITGSYVLAQGSGNAGLNGVGALFDLAGNDSYSISSPPTADKFRALFGQGLGVYGTGVLIDTGVGNDTYSLEAGDITQTTDQSRAWAAVYGQGAGYQALAQGILYDDGGSDSIVATAATTWTPDREPDVPQSGETPLYFFAAPISQVAVQGFGFGFHSVGMLLQGRGDTTYTAEGNATGMVSQYVQGQGFGWYGEGVVDDQGGDDTYTLRGTDSYERDLIVDDSCRTSSQIPCKQAAATVNQASGMHSLVFGQGSGWGSGFPFGIGLLDDHAGNDSYAAADEYHLNVSLHDELTDPTAPPSLQVWSGSVQPQLLVQGQGSTAGVGLLLDAGGTDSYVANYVKQTAASATSDHAPGPPQVRATNWYRIGVAAQGATWLGRGYGALLDLGGVGDRFSATATLPISTSPDPAGAYAAGYPYPTFQGSGSSLDSPGIFVADGTDPQIFSSPSQVVCPQSSAARGFGTWGECGLMDAGGANHEPIDLYRHAYGRAANASGQAPALAFTSDTPKNASAGPGWVSAAVRLVDPDGNPVAGATIHFDLQDTIPSQSTSWVTNWEVDAVTGADGVARAQVPLDGSDQGIQAYPDIVWRLFATYDGAPGLYPKHAASLLTLASGQ